jgi:hypothetical protein
MHKLQVLLNQILTAPEAADLWKLQVELLALGGETAERAREVAREFYGCLRGLESKIGSRRASRWAAALQTASVTSIGLQEMLMQQENPLHRLLSSSFTALLEVGAAVKHVEAWNIEAALAYHDIAWYLCGELWAVSTSTQPDLAATERQAHIDALIRPILDPTVPDPAKCALAVRLFQVVLAGRMCPLVTGGE